MLKTLIFPLLFTAVCTLVPIESFAQGRAVISKRVDARVTPVRKQNFNVTAELRRQQKFLGDIATRYEEVSTRDLTPLLNYPHVWNALRENRMHVSQPKVRIAVSQARLFKRAYDRLEEDTLLRLLNHQLSLLNESLELDEEQLTDIQKILTIDFSNKRTLLSNARVSDADFRRTLDLISDGTERAILSILSPEQRKMVDRQLNFHRDRLVG